MTTYKESPVFWGMVALASALVLASLIGSLTVMRVKRGGDAITVTGSARKPIRSDFIIWRGSVGAKAESMQLAYPDLKRYTERVQTYLKEKNIPDQEIAYSPVQTEAIYETLEDGRSTGRILWYVLTQHFAIGSANVDGITALSRQATELIEEGIPFISRSPEYLFTKLADLRVEMLAEATRDAQTRADMMAENAGSHVGAVRSARSGVFQITPRHSTEISDYGMNDTTALEKDITAVVVVTFAIR